MEKSLLPLQAKQWRLWTSSVMTVTRNSAQTQSAVLLVQAKLLGNQFQYVQVGCEAVYLGTLNGSITSQVDSFIACVVVLFAHRQNGFI